MSYWVESGVFVYSNILNSNNAHKYVFLEQ